MRLSTLAPTLLLTFGLLLSACSPSIYMAQDFRSYAARHKTVAILPADVTLQLRPNQTKHMSAEQMQETTAKTGLDFQDRIYAWMLRRSQQRAFTVQFQDVRQTNALLRQSGIPFGELRTHTP